MPRNAEEGPLVSTEPTLPPDVAAKAVRRPEEPCIGSDPLGDQDWKSVMPPDWKSVMRGAIRSAAELFAELELDPADLPAAVRAAGDFPVVVPRPYLNRIERGNPRDPLLLQVLPAAEESLPAPGFVADPLEESRFSPAPGMLQKYAGRALLVLTGTCAVHCRYCFRRSFPYDERPRNWSDWEPALRRIEEDPTLREVLLSGGDPLSLVDETLERFFSRLDANGRLERIRLHTRLPIVVPQRVTDRLLSLLRSLRAKPVVVVHANHPRELDDETLEALSRLRATGAIVLNQSVLLRGVNDDADVLAALSERLLQAGALPYYLHQMDRVAGAAHFEVPTERGKELHRELLARLPGYAVPRYVRETPGEASKLPID
jgi:EF-P beta-lysylation protein EpmB